MPNLFGLWKKNVLQGGPDDSAAPSGAEMASRSRPAIRRPSRQRFARHRGADHPVAAGNVLALGSPRRSCGCCGLGPGVQLVHG